LSEAIFQKRPPRYSGEVGLFPVDEDGVELLHRKIKDGKQVAVAVTQRRNPRHHRLYFAILKFLSEHTETFAGRDPEIISTAVKLATGLVKTFVDVETGRPVMVPLSISWGAMDQTRFNEFFDRACDVIANRWMPAGTTSDAVRDELLAMVDGNAWHRGAA
jgi:hypothetical protein